jgi:hypothetical protein
MFLPWLFFKPVVNAFATVGFVCLTVITALAPYLYRKVSHRLEERADQMARLNEPDPGAYARALARMHEDNLLPAVHAKSRETHPDLYDRLIAAGFTPDYPRPVAPKAMAWHGQLFAGGMGLLAAMLIMRLMNGV